MTHTTAVDDATLTARRRIRRMINLAFACVALFVIGTIGRNLEPSFDDSRQYRQGARNLVETGDPYTTTRLSGSQYLPFPNPPLLAYLLVPTLPLGEEGGRFAWFILNVTAGASLFWLVLRLTGPAWAHHYWGPLALGLAYSPPTYLCLLYGQFGLMLALLLVASFALSTRHTLGAGATLAFATAIKLYPGLPAIYYLVRGPRRVVWWAAAVGALLVLIPLLFHGLRPYQAYVETVLFGTVYPYAAEFNVSLLGFWRRLFTLTSRFTAFADAPTLALTLTVVTAFATLALCGWFTRVPGELGALLAFSMWLCATMLLSPINGYYNLTGLLLPLLVIARSLTHYPSIGLSAGALVSTMLICAPPGWYEGWPELTNFLLHGWGLVALVPGLFGIYGYLAILAVQAYRHQQAWQAPAEVG